MKKEVTPAMAIALIAVVVLIAVAAVWKGTQKAVKLPDKPPSGPIELPPSQMGRRMPGGVYSGSMPGAPQGNGK